MLNIISIIITGLVVGVLARFIYPGAVDMGLLRTALLGIGGALLAGLVASRGNGSMTSGINNAGFIASIVGALALIFIGRQF